MILMYGALEGGKNINVVGNTIINPFNAALAATFDTSAIYVSNQSEVQDVLIANNLISDNRTLENKGMNVGIQVGLQT